MQSRLFKQLEIVPNSTDHGLLQSPDCMQSGLFKQLKIVPKRMFDMGILKTQVREMLMSVTKDWRKAKRKQRREQTRHNRLKEDRATEQPSFLDVAVQIITLAYMQVSNNGRLYALCRQLFYECREQFRQICGEMPSDTHFRKMLRSVMKPDWKVAFDPRGNFVEPHSDVRIPLGTIDCDEYAETFPEHRFAGVLFIEKEGFLPLLQDAGILQKYDLAVMGCKGQSVEAARHLIDVLCKDRPLFIVRDFDKAGFHIAAALTRDSDVYTFRNKINATDFGLRLADAERFGLIERCETLDPIKDAKKIPKTPLENATPEENEFLMSGRRVELNAFRSADFITWLEEKLEQSGIQKVVPDEQTLTGKYVNCERDRLTQLEMEAVRRRVEKKLRKFKAPDGLADLVREQLEVNRRLSWESAVAAVHTEIAQRVF